MSRSACTAAPSATTWSGSMSPSGSRPNSSATKRRTAGTRVEPPTRITPSSSAARHARVLERAPARPRPVRCDAAARSTPRSSRARDASAVAARARARASCASVSASFACARRGEHLGDQRRGGRALRPAPASTRWAMARSKSSPPSAESPPVDFTSKTPSTSLRMEMSKVPPPRS